VTRTAAPRAVLLGGVRGDASLSMRRFAQDLFLAMSAETGSHWEVELIQPEQRRWASRVWRDTQAIRMESAIARYVCYPARLLGRSGDLFHVLDHAYGHLVRVLDPSKTIVTCHDLIPLLAADGRVPIAVPASVVRTVRLRVNEMVRARRILTDSEATRTDLLHYTNVSAATVTVIPPGINPIFTPASAEEAGRLRTLLGVPRDVVVVLQVATRGRYKNTPTVLKAFALLRQRLGSQVLLARIHDDEAELARSLGIGEGIRQLGIVDDPTLAQWYRAANVLAFPSLWEGFGWPPLEAMASGTPVVASPIASVVEFAAGAAALIDPFDEYELAAALERVVCEPAYAASLCQRGLERAKALTWAATARKTLAVYEEVAPCDVERRRRGPWIDSTLLSRGADPTRLH
jgi:glycosyltransferase involved in cell wall biosynthesis